MLRRRKIYSGIPARAGNAGIIASFGIAFAGILIGALSAYISEHGAAARAAKTEAMSVGLREGRVLNKTRAMREKIIQQVLTGDDLERLPVPEFTARGVGRPKVIIILDDMGVDRRNSELAMQLPGPLTYSFLPYARDVDILAAKAREGGDEIMVHLPMEPQGDSDPGPHALKLNMTGAEFIKELEWNLNRFEGYVGVNNHMGSKLTPDEAAMKTILAYLDHKQLFFMDSVTTGDTIVPAAGAKVGAQVFSRDVFLDAETGSVTAVKRQLELVERIARKTGYAVAIGHPRKETLEALGPWLVTAPARGFELVPVTTLVDLESSDKPPIASAAPALRL